MAITVVQHASNTATHTSGTSATDTATFASNLTAGNCVVACISTGSVFTAVSVTSVTTNGSAENWSQAVGDPFSSGANYIYVNPNTGGGQKIIDVNWAFGGTVSSTNTASIVIEIYEISGLVAANVVDQSNQNNVSSNANWTSNATPTTTQASEIFIGKVSTFASTSANTITGPSSPWNNESQLNATYLVSSVTRHLTQLSGFQIVSATGTATYSGTQTDTGNDADSIVVTLKGIPSSAYPSPAIPGSTWKRRFQRQKQTFKVTGYINASATFSGSGSIVLSGFQEFPGLPFPAQPIQPGRTWRRRFKPRAQTRPLPHYVAIGSITMAGSGSMSPAFTRLVKTLIVSVAAQSGTDAFGNAYVQGLGVYGFGKLVSPEVDVVSDKGGLFVYRSGS